MERLRGRKPSGRVAFHRHEACLPAFIATCASKRHAIVIIRVSAQFHVLDFRRLARIMWQFTGLRVCVRACIAYGQVAAIN